MIKFRSSDHLSDLQVIQSVLEESDIRCFIKNEFSQGAAGGLPGAEIWPELWLANDEDLERAKAVIAAWEAEPQLPLSDWQCPECQTTIEREFNLCWSCGHVLPLG